MIINIDEIKAKMQRINTLADQADAEWERANAVFWELQENPDSTDDELDLADKLDTAAAARLHRFEILRDLADDAMQGLYMLMTALEDIEIESEGLELGL